MSYIHWNIVFKVSYCNIGFKFIFKQTMNIIIEISLESPEPNGQERTEELDG